MDQAAEKVAREFIESWEHMTPDVMANAFAEDGVFVDTPRGVYEGREAIRAAAAVYPPMVSEIVSISSDDGVVWMERIDRFETHGMSLALEIGSVIEVGADGLIRRQRDYYDMKGLLDELRSAGIAVDA